MKKILRCRIFAGSSQLIAGDVGILVEDGTVSDVGKFADIRTTSAGAQTLGFDGIICPALINAHTHLELSPFKAVPHSDFVDWVLHLVASRYSRIDEDLSGECLKAKGEAEKLGTSYFVNVGNNFRLNRMLGRNQLFQFEQLGISDDAADDIFSKAVSLASTIGGVPTALAIHSPYSTSSELMKKIKAFNNEMNLTTSIHLAETEDEVEFVKSGTGRMVDLLDSRLGPGKWSFSATGLSPVEYVDSIGLLDEKTLCVHCVFAVEKDFEILEKRGCGVAACVRSNRNLTDSVPNVAGFVKRGIKVFLGTDSKASSPDLDMFAEMSAFYEEFHELFSPSEVFRMATTDVADFLGIKDSFGGIAPGMNAPLVHVPFGGRVEDAFEFLVTEAKGKTEVVTC